MCCVCILPSVSILSCLCVQIATLQCSGRHLLLRTLVLNVKLYCSVKIISRIRQLPTLLEKIVPGFVLILREHVGTGTSCLSSGNFLLQKMPG